MPELLENQLLALRWRPAKFSEIIGQPVPVKLLSKSVELRRLFPCYLISGPFGSGKTTLARIFSKGILCDLPIVGEPCEICDSCVQFSAGTNPNYSELDSASHGSVDDVRRLRDESLFKPFGGKRKRVVYLDEAGSITRAGNNAFLKLLEEGAESVIFVMTTTDPDNILDTVKSRCFEIELSKLTTLEIYQRLVHVASIERIGFDVKALRLIASYSQGHMRDALMLLDQMRIMGTVTEESAREMLKVDTRVEMFKLYHAVATDFSLLLKILEGVESRLTAFEIWRGLLESVVDCYLIYRQVQTDLDPVEAEWARKITEQGPTFLTTFMQLIQQLTPPRNSAELRFNLCQLVEKCGKRSPTTSANVNSLRDLARRSPVVNK